MEKGRKKKNKENQLYRRVELVEQSGSSQGARIEKKECGKETKRRKKTMERKKTMKRKKTKRRRGGVLRGHR